MLNVSVMEINKGSKLLLYCLVPVYMNSSGGRTPFILDVSARRNWPISLFFFFVSLWYFNPHSLVICTWENVSGVYFMLWILGVYVCMWDPQIQGHPMTQCKDSVGTEPVYVCWLLSSVFTASSSETQHITLDRGWIAFPNTPHSFLHASSFIGSQNAHFVPAVSFHMAPRIYEVVGNITDSYLS